MSEEKAAAPKKGGSKVIVIALTAILVAGAAVAGTMFGPKMLGAKPAQAQEDGSHGKSKGKKHQEEAEDVEPTAIYNFQAIVVDLHDNEGAIHHLKVGLTVESALENAKEAEEALKQFQPRGREAAIAFLRSREWDEITSSKMFEPLKKELSEKVIGAMGEERVSRVVITDFVAQ
ncbi:MAG: flagellar basal body-associated FliL family protein [Myxococcota bacterium]|nr:flagellar basal body-associated FliL family protein [Myxococcota bacterium]